MPTAHHPQASQLANGKYYFKCDCGLLAGIRDLWHIVLVKLCRPSVFRNGPLFVRANGISHFPEPTDDPAQLRCVVQPLSLANSQPAAGLEIGQNFILRIVFHGL